MQGSSPCELKLPVLDFWQPDFLQKIHALDCSACIFCQWMVHFSFRERLGESGVFIISMRSP